ncbi:MAG: NAD-dependent epimerase/dehydratase family protein [Candidatus Aenigmarchaeota archaeon]|nr:NAD-dependent epimerase/dehydratase family protein [Candidatus Aenigmarchaeota archaeon]
MKILITGIAGFIGSNLAERLVKDGHEVLGYDNFLSGLPDNVKNLNIEMVEKIDDLKVDKIFHLGMPSSSPMYREDRFKIIEAVEITLKVLELAKKLNVHIVYATTSSIYNGNEPPYKEDMKVHITDFYTEARYFIERLFDLYDKFYGITSVGLRFFSVYGPNDQGKGKYANTVTQFALDMINGKEPVLYGDGSQERDFIHVEDVVEALIKASEHKKTDIFNTGTGKAYSFNDLIGAINKALGTEIKPKYIENPFKAYLSCTLADTTKAENVLGFKSKYEFEEGIKKQVEYLKKINNEV